MNELSLVVMMGVLMATSMAEYTSVGGDVGDSVEIE